MSRRGKPVPQTPLLFAVPALDDTAVRPSPSAPRPAKAAKAGKRAVLLVAQDQQARDAARWIDLAGRFAAQQGLNVMAICWTVTDALSLLAQAKADVLIAISSRDLWPLIRFVAVGEFEDDPATRRPRLVPDGQRRVRRTYRI